MILLFCCGYFVVFAVNLFGCWVCLLACDFVCLRFVIFDVCVGFDAYFLLILLITLRLLSMLTVWLWCCWLVVLGVWVGW